MLARAFAASALSHEEAVTGLLEEARFLVEAAAGAGVRPEPAAVAGPSRGLPPWWDFHGRAVRMIEFFEMLEQRERNSRASARGRFDGQFDPDASITAGGGLT